MPGNLSPISALQSVSQLTEAAKPTFAARKARDVPKEFEAFVMQSFIQEMLPKNAEGVYGTGVAGDIWRSMLAEKLAFEVAERGDIGIAKEVRAAQTRKADGAASAGVASGPAAAIGAEVQAAAPAPSGGNASTWKTEVERS